MSFTECSVRRWSPREEFWKCWPWARLDFRLQFIKGLRFSLSSAVLVTGGFKLLGNNRQASGGLWPEAEYRVSASRKSLVINELKNFRETKML